MLYPITTKPVIIIGAGGHAKVLIDVLRLNRATIIGILDVKTYTDNGQNTFCDITILGNDNKVRNYNPQDVLLVNAVGSADLPIERKAVFEKFKKMGFCFATVIHPSAIMASDVVLGEGVQIMVGVVVQPGVKIGYNSILNSSVSVNHNCIIGDHVHIAPGSILSGGVCVANLVHIGTGTKIIQDVKVETSVLIGVGTVVIKDIPAYAIVVGVPGKILRMNYPKADVGFFNYSGSIEFEDAVRIFEGFESAKKSPFMHPEFVRSDVTNLKDATPVFFVYSRKDDVYYHAFCKCLIPGEDVFDIQSVYGYGGPISSSNDELFLRDAWNAYLGWCRDNRILVDFIRFHPVLGNWCYYFGEIIENRKTIWVDLKKKDLLSTYSIRVRTAIRKAIKNEVKIIWSKRQNYVRNFIELYYQNMRILGADKFYFFDAGHIKQILTWQKACLIVAMHGEQMIAGAIFLCDQVMEYYLSAANLLGKQLAATNLILHEAALFGQRCGYSILHLGGGTNNLPDNPLLFFKAGFSSNLKSFKIGRYIHDLDNYSLLKKTHVKFDKGHEFETRVLFYRF